MPAGDVATIRERLAEYEDWVGVEFYEDMAALVEELDRIKETQEHARKQATFWYLGSLVEDMRPMTKQELILYEAYRDTPEVASDGWKPGWPVYQAAWPKD